jgi:hypothetical protein
MVFKVLPDIGILMIVGILPDYVLGVVKLWRALSPRRPSRPTLAAAA